MIVSYGLLATTERYPTKYTRSVKVQISSGMNDVIDVICTLLLRKYPSIDAVYQATLLWAKQKKSLWKFNIHVRLRKPSKTVKLMKKCTLRRNHLAAQSVTRYLHMQAA